MAWSYAVLRVSGLTWLCVEGKLREGMAVIS